MSTACNKNSMKNESFINTKGKSAASVAVEPSAGFYFPMCMNAF